MKRITADYTHHIQVPYTVCKVHIDIGILPIIKWLNSFKGVMTRWSCEGDDTPGREEIPYIVVWVEILTETAKKAKQIVSLKENPETHKMEPVVIDNKDFDIHSNNEWKKVLYYFAKFFAKFGIQLLIISEQGDVHVFHILFPSRSSMLESQKAILKQYRKDMKNPEKMEEEFNKFWSLNSPKNGGSL